MDENRLEPTPELSNKDQAESSSLNKRQWQSPKLTFVEPSLTKQGELSQVTGQFFGAFSVPGTD